MCSVCCKHIKSEMVLSEYINHIKMELYGRGETIIHVGVESEGKDGDGMSHCLSRQECLLMINLGLTPEECDKVVASLERVSNKLDCSLTLLRSKVFFISL